MSFCLRGGLELEGGRWLRILLLFREVGVARRHRTLHHLLVVVLREQLAVLGETSKTCHLVINYWFSLPLVDPLLFLVQVFGYDVNLCEGPILNLSSLFMRRTVLDVFKIVFIRLHTDLAVCVLLIWDRL